MEKIVIYPVDIEKIDIARQSRIAQRYILQDIYLVGAKISRDPLVPLPKSITLEHECYTNRFWYEKNRRKHYKILCNFQVAAFNVKSPHKLIMKIEASFCTNYAYKFETPAAKPTVILDLTVGDIEEYSKDMIYEDEIIPILDAWPYWREFVQNMSARMAFPALTVPPLEIVPEKSAAIEDESQPIKENSTRSKKVKA
jgi:hypothetical protein